jgi:bacteriocin-like protein
MSNLSSQQPEALACELLSDDELQAVSGGVAYAIGRVAPGVIPGPGGNVANLGSLAGIRPIICNACVQGIPRDLVTNPAFNQVVRAGR